MHKKLHFLLTPLAALTFALCLPGCIVVPVRTPTVIKNPAGKKASLPVEALVPGETTREQMETQYKPFAVDSGVPSLFWGRFRKSSWALLGGTVGAAGAERVWGAHNLLASFDDNGILKAFETVPEDKLLAKLVTMQETQQFPALNLSPPVLVSGKTIFPRGETIDFQLSAHEMVITKTPILYRVPKKPPKKPPTPPKVGAIPIAQIMAVKIHPGEVEEVSDISLEMQFSAKTTFGKKIFFTAKPGAALTLVRWLEQEKEARNNSQHES